MFTIMHDVYELFLWSSAFRMSSFVTDAIVFVFLKIICIIFPSPQIFSILNTKNNIKILARL